MLVNSISWFLYDQVPAKRRLLCDLSLPTMACCFVCLFVCFLFLFYAWSLHMELTKNISADSQLSYKLKRNFVK